MIARDQNEKTVKEKEKDGGCDDELVAWRATGWRAKLGYVVRNATVEPMLGCYIVASVLASLATQNLSLQKACRVNLRFGDQVCSALERRETRNYTAHEIQVQQLVADMITWKTMVQSSIPAALIIFVGAWSDRTGRRKPGMLAPIVGELLSSIGLMLCTYYFYELPMEVAGLTEAIFPALTGGWMTMFMAVFSYVGDITTVKTRTLRIGVVNVFCSVGIPIGTALSGLLYRELGSYGVYTISSALYVFAFFYGLLAIPESGAPASRCRLRHPRIQPKTKEEPAQGDAVTPAAVDWPSHGHSRRHCFLAKFFDLHHIREAFAVAFKDDGHSRRLRIVMLMIVVIVVMGPLHGEMTVLYLFTRVRFNWNEVDFSLFSTYMMVTNLLGTVLSVSVFSHVLEIDDALIGVMSCTSKILAGFVYAFATSPFIFYLAPLVDIINGTSFIAMRSIISKLVPPDELGKVNSLFGVCEAIVPLIYGPMYSHIYKKTLKTMPGAFFIIGGALTLPAVIIFWWMYTVHKKRDGEYRKAKEAEMRRKAAKTTSSGAVKTGKNTSHSVLSSSDLDLRTILDRRTQYRRGSARLIGIDNASFRSSKEDAA